ncbi:hypothetical protein D3C76_804620 [compost metagenome]
MDALQAPTQGQARIGQYVRFKHAIHQWLFRVADVLEILAVGVGRHQAATQLAIKGQGAGDIQLAAVVVPGTRRHIEGHLVTVQRPFAHQVDDATRVPGATEQS